MEVRRRERWAGAVVALTVALAGMATAFRAHAVEAGQAAPAVELPGSKGPVSLAQWQGKLVYLDFWASWCGPCRQSFPWMNDMQARYGERGLQVVAVNLDARRGDGEKFLAQVPASFPVAFDPNGETARRYAIKGMPSSVLIGPDGRVVRVHEGFRPEQRQALEAAIVAALPAAR
jgi:cytochrome c biogenesis protein CcmG/thiol:disulfide interchange protein DsbE